MGIMKFILALAAIAYAAEQDEACTKEEGECGEDLCCGVATQKADNVEEGKEAETKTLCNAKDSEEWNNPDDDQVWSFKCGLPKAEGASKIALSAAALLSATYMMA